MRRHTQTFTRFDAGFFSPVAGGDFSIVKSSPRLQKDGICLFITVSSIDVRLGPALTEYKA